MAETWQMQTQHTKTTPGTVKFLAHKFIPLLVQQNCKAPVVSLYNTHPRSFATTLMACNAQGTALHIHSSINPGLKTYSDTVQPTSASENFTFRLHYH